MQYGQSIPPKTFIDTKPQFFTKQGFANYMARAIQTVGMLPLSVNSYDIADPANAERDPGGNENPQFWFDYPTSESFVPGGSSDPTPYRPCLGMMNTLYRSFYTNGSNWIGGVSAYYLGHDVGFKHYRRRADRLSRGDFRNYRMLYNGSTYNNNFGFMNSTDSYSYADGEGGAITGFNNWKLFASWTDPNQQQLLFVNRIFVHLGKAGLIVQVGTHPTRRAETANIMNFAALFHGGRIPGRARAVIDDVLRDTIDPVAFVDLGTTYVSDYNTNYPHANGSNADMTSVSLGGARTFGGVFQGYTDTCVIEFLRSIDYLDESVVYNAPVDVYPRPSPAIVNGNGVHALHRACLLPFRNMGASIYMGRIDPVKQPNLQPMHKWEDAYYFPGLALGDRVMTPGRKIDPNTGKNWYSIWANPRGQSFALDYDGVTEVVSPTAGATAPVLKDTIPLDLTTAGALTPSYTRNISRSTPVFYGMNMDTVAGSFASGVGLKLGQYEMSNIDALMKWTKAAGTNEFLLTSWGWTSFDTTKYFALALDLTGLMPGTDPSIFYTVEFDYFCRSSDDNVGNPQSGSYFEMQVFVTPGNIGSSLIGNSERYISNGAGSPSYHNTYYSYANYGALGNSYPVGAADTYRSDDKIRPDVNGKASILFQLMHNYGNSVTKLTCGIRNIVLKRYKLG